MPCSLLSSGSNAHGQLSHGTLDDSHNFTTCFFDHDSEESSSTSPSPVLPNNSKILQIGSGANHTLLLSESNEDTNKRRKRTLWGCGDGSSGQLGNLRRDTKGKGDDITVFRPIDLQLSEYGLVGYQPRLICASWETSYVVLSYDSSGSEGDVKVEKPDVLISMGNNDFGDLGVGLTPSGRTDAGTKKVFHIVKFDHLLVDGDGASVDGGSVKVTSIVAGQHHVVVQIHARLRVSDEVVQAETQARSLCQFIVGWGAARHGQLGDTSTLSKKTPFFSLPKIIDTPYGDEDPVISFATGAHHTVFLHESGRLSSMGSNKKNQLALNTLHDTNTDPVTLSMVSFVGCTWNGTYAVDSGKLYATGSYERGQLGIGPLCRPSPESNACLSPKYRGQSGHSPVKVQFPFSFDALDASDHVLNKIACGSEHVLALVLRTQINSGTDGNCTVLLPEVWGWGWNEHGNLGLGETSDVYTPTRIWPASSLKMGMVRHIPDDALSKSSAVGIWAGCGTSWIALEESEPSDVTRSEILES